jgi:Ca2+-binding RTX toxin-like protein
MWKRKHRGPHSSRLTPQRPSRRVRRAKLSGFDRLETRATPAITAIFSPGAGLLTVLGDALNNSIVVNRNAAGTILVNNGAVPVQGGTPTVANTSLIQMFGLAGDDNLALDETNGALPKANLFGGSGSDSLIGGSGADQLFGQAGNDTLLGKGGIDLLFGGADNDMLTGGTGDDQVFGESGNDRMIWNPGDRSDLNDGGTGIDTVEVNGGNGAETFTATANGTRVRFDRVAPAPFSLDIGTSENLVVNMNGGDDSFSASGNLAALIQLRVDGGTGNDTILGSDGADLLIGGDGNDFIDGNRGNDVALLGAGDDVFQWDPGDSSDTIEGQGGGDTMVFNGANVSENIEISASGKRVRFFRNVANVTIDLNGVETIDFNARGGADTVTVNDVSGTDLAQVNLDLAGVPGSGVGDAQPDLVIVNATSGDDVVTVAGGASGVAVQGLAARVNITGIDAGSDKLQVSGQAGADVINASGLAGGAVQLTLLGGTGSDLLIGSSGDDLLIGQGGNDAALMGAGNDTFVWSPGDGSDVVEGQAGNDTMIFNGGNVSENIDISANGARVLLLRDVANVVMDLNDVESIDVNALGGADRITVSDLSGTGVTEVNLNLAGADGGGDGRPDSVFINGTNGDDVIGLAGDANGVAVLGLAAQVNITGTEPSNDRLSIKALSGDDVVEASGLSADAIQLTEDGGDGDDVLIGSAGADVLLGGAGDDVLIGGPGPDILDGGPGSNIVIQD